MIGLTRSSHEPAAAESSSTVIGEGDCARCIEALHGAVIAVGKARSLQRRPRLHIPERSGKPLRRSALTVGLHGVYTAR